MLLITLLITFLPIGILKLGMDDINNKIVALLVILSTEIFIMTVGYLEKIAFSTRKLDEYANNMEKISLYKEPNGTDFLKYATKSIFISGPGMQVIYDIRNLLASIDEKIPITLAIQNYNNRDLVNVLIHYFGINEKEWMTRRSIFNEGIKIIYQKRNLNIIVFNKFSPIGFVAIDYKDVTENSIIQAKHYILSEDIFKANYYFCRVKPGIELFDIYREQILCIEKYSSQFEGNQNIIE